QVPQDVPGRERASLVRASIGDRDDPGALLVDEHRRLARGHPLWLAVGESFLSHDRRPAFGFLIERRVGDAYPLRVDEMAAQIGRTHEDALSDPREEHAGRTVAAAPGDER